MSNFFSFKGRIGRKDYVFFGIVNVFLHLFILSLIIYFLSNPIIYDEDFWFLILIMFLPISVMSFFIFYLPVTVKRFHDIDMSCLWVLLTFIPVIGLIIYIILAMIKGQDGPNKYGPDPRDKKTNSKKK